MSMWQRIKSIQIPGNIWAPILTGALLGTTGVLFIRLPISPTVDRTLGESIFGKKENPKEVNVELPVKVIGSGIMGHVQNSKTTSNSLERSVSPEKSCHCTGHLEGSTTKRPDSSSSITF